MADNVDELFGEPIAEQPEIIEAPEPVAEVIEPTPEPEAPAEPIVQKEPEAPMVPRAALMSERDKRQLLEARVRQFEEAQSRAEQPVPDALDDPSGYNAYVQEQIASAVQQHRVETSWTLAVRDHGKDKVEEAKQWALEKAQADPIFRGQVDVAFRSEALPIEWVVQQHAQSALLAQIGDPNKLDDWFQAEAAKRGYVMQDAPAAATVAAAPQPASPPVKVPRSLASHGTGPSDIRQTATGPLAGVDALFG